MKKKAIGLTALEALFVIFVIISLLWITPEAKVPLSDTHSSQLYKRIVMEGDTEITEYLDEKSQLAIAAELGYAMRIIKYGNHIQTEFFYDDRNMPARMYYGYYGITRSYDEQGRIKSVTYLDADGNPVMISDGYAEELREYNENGQTVTVWYCNTEGNPVPSSSNGYGRVNQYNENGKISTVTYIDASGTPMMTRQGYASVSRKYYESGGVENGKVESEFYFDETGNPVSLSLGQYGVHKEYDENGRESVLTYLDADGNPTVTTKGYTTVLRTFQADNSVATERYFDMDGNPFSLSEGQYGKKTENGQTTYLNANGVEKFNIRTLLYNQSYLVILFALAIVLLSVFLEKRWNLLLLIAYIAAIAYITLMFRENDGGKIKPELFWSYKNIFINSEDRADILKNIWLLIPLGAILYRLCPKKCILLIPVALSIFIEANQYFAEIGICEFDDVISNCLGGIIGFGSCKLLCELKSRLFVRHNSHRITA